MKNYAGGGSSVNDRDLGKINVVLLIHQTIKSKFYERF